MFPEAPEFAPEFRDFLFLRLNPVQSNCNLIVSLAGPLLCLKADDAVYFYDWDVQERGPIRKIAASPKNVWPIPCVFVST